MKFYAGIGSRDTPSNVLVDMAYIAKRLGEKGYTLRSGGADGADTWFEHGASSHERHIYLPWNGFNSRYVDGKSYFACDENMLLRDIALEYHPMWNKLTTAAKKLHTRNVAQVLGNVPSDEPKSEFVICWTPGGKGGGGTGQAIRIARAFDVPVYDLAIDASWVRIAELMQ